MIYCFMFSGKPITDQLRTTLYMIAHDMIEQKQKQLDIRSDFAEGFVTTDAVTRVMGGVSGVQFHAHVEWGGGKTTVDYLVRSGDLPDFEYVNWEPI